ncbi:PAS domain S-box protein [Sulfuricurvum sp.]|uniref:PAS domain S-box protein n=1 Tax=Sulfuricurvum sp. TaxID=2025608 RepID=UPI002E375F80|nr:PAS domain S-box protein [Sulfuricurvum sp.]HEX5328754.1 PAS domain S-box protein [Sulfuricurvum sp.]
MVVIFVFSGYFLGIFSHHMSLFYYTREKSYLYFSLYAASLYVGVLSIIDDTKSMGHNNFLSFPVETLFLQFFHVALILFTLHINETKVRFPALYRFSLGVALVVFLGIAFLLRGESGVSATSLFAMVAFFLSLGITLFTLWHRSLSSYGYFLALFPLFLAAFLYAADVNTPLPSVDDMSQIVFIGAIWNMASLALLISRKIRSLQEEKEKAILQNTIDAHTLFLQSRNASMGEMIADIAHQWKQPLNAIGNIQNGIKASLLYEGGISKENLLDSLNTSFGLLRHLAETIDTFYGFLAQHHRSQKSFILSEEVEKIQKLTEYTFQNSNITLRVSLESDPTIQGDANEFIHVLLNLVLNAKDALERTNPSSPVIDIHVVGGDETCRISVSDNAGGIKIDPIESVFERYITSKPNGSGLGLYMVREIVNRFGGEISVENRNEGACVTITLPYSAYATRPMASSHEEKKTMEEMRRLTNKVLELEQNEHELRRWAEIFEHAHWGIVIYKAESTAFIKSNMSFKQLYGYTDRELKNLGIIDLFAPSERENFVRLKQQYDTQGYLFTEALHRRRDGSMFPVNIEVFWVKDSADNDIYIIANIWDLSERKIAENALASSEAAFRAMVEHSPDVISRYDLQGRRIYVNPMMRWLLGKPMEEIIGKTPREFSPLPDIDRFEQLFEKAVRKRTEIEQESTYTTPWGETRWGHQRIIPEFDYEGNVSGIMVIGRDITPYKTVEQRLQKTATQLRALFDTIPDLIWMKNPDGVYLMCNHAFEQFFGAREADIVGKTDYDYVEKELADFFRQKDTEAIENGMVSINYEEVIYHSTGKSVLLETRKSAVYGADGSLLGILGIAKEVVETKTI